MKRRTFISLMGVMAAAGVLSLTGCSSKDTAASTASTASSATLNKLDSIQKSGKLVVALEGAWQPWSYHDASDTLVGYDVEVSRAIAEKLGVEPEYVESDWDSLFAGLDAGRYDMVCNGVEVTDANYKTLGQYVYDGSVEIAVSQVTWEDNGSTPVLSSKGNIQLGAASFTDPAIYMDKVVGIDGTDKKVGYLLYMGFNIDYDDELMAAFERFRQQNVTDLILDLRYNNGGDVLSSTVLGTLIAGEAYKGQLYAHMTFNEDRTEACLLYTSPSPRDTR